MKVESRQTAEHMAVALKRIQVEDPSEKLLLITAATELVDMEDRISELRAMLSKQESPPLQIEKGIPVHAKSNVLARFPLRAMEVGDSFTVPNEECQKLRVAIVSMRNSVTGSNMRFTTRKISETQTRCWRTE